MDWLRRQRLLVHAGHFLYLSYDLLHPRIQLADDMRTTTTFAITLTCLMLVGCGGKKSEEMKSDATQDDSLAQPRENRRSEAENQSGESLALQSDEEVGEEAAFTVLETGKPLVDAVRDRPWDRSAIEALVESIEGEPQRAELARVDIELEGLEYPDPQRKSLIAERMKIVDANKARWVGRLGELGDRCNVKFRFGLVDEIRVRGLTDAEVSMIQAHPEVRHLDLSNPELTMRGYGELFRLPHIDHLTIDGGKFSKDLADQLEKLPPSTWIDLYVEDIDWNVLDQMHERRVKLLSTFTGEEKLGAGAKFLNGAMDYRLPIDGPPTNADLGQIGMRDSLMPMLSGLSELQGIYISECDLTEKGIESLAGLSKLEGISLFDTKVKSIAALDQLKALKTLSLYPSYGTIMGDSGVAAIENFTALEELYLSDQGITDATLVRMKALTGLRKVDLTIGGGIENEDCLAAIAGMTRLEQLSLSPAINESGLRHFADLKELEKLSLRVNGGTGDGFKAIAGLTKLKRLAINGDAVTDQALGHLSSLKSVSALISQDSAVTLEGAEKLAAQLPHVTILLKEHVVKSPKTSQVFERHKFQDVVSVLAPQEWSVGGTDEGDFSATEDGWDLIGGYSGEHVGPVEVYSYIDPEAATAQDALMASVNNNSHLNPKVLSRNVLKTDGRTQGVSCIYTNDFGKYLVCVRKVGGKFLVLDCHTNERRFATYEPWFRLMADSVRISDSPKDHVQEPIEVPADNLK